MSFFRCFRALMGLALPLWLSACSPQPGQTLALSGFSLTVPAGWQVQTSSDMPVLLRPVDAWGHAIPGAYFYVRLDQPRDGAAPTLSDYVAYQELQARQFTRRYARVQAGETRLHDVEAVRVLRDYGNEHENRRERAVLLIHNGTGYALVGSARDRDFGRLSDAFDRIVASLHWTT